jgi:ATP-binding cassette subfamily B protein RaxB
MSDEKHQLNFSLRRRLPVIIQTESAECGLACIAMIAHYYGNKEGLPELRRANPIPQTGASLATLMRIADTLGMQGRPLRLEFEQISFLRTPCVLHWGMDHFVVLNRVTSKYLIIHDPEYGERRVSMGEASKFFTGVALELTPGANFKRAPVRPSIGIRQIFGKIIGLKSSLAYAIVLALVLEIFSLVAPLYVQILIDHVLTSGDYALLGVVGTGFLFIVGMQTLVTALRSWLLTSLGARLNFSASANIFSHLIRLPVDYFTKRSMGDVVSRFGAINTLQQTLTTKFVEVILDGLMTFVTLCLMMAYGKLLALFSVTAFALYILVRWVSYRIVREANLGQIMASANQQTLFIEAVRGQQTIKGFNKCMMQSARFSNRATTTVNATVGVQRFNIIFTNLNNFIFGAQKIIMLWVGAYMAMNGEISAGMLVAFMSYSDQFTSRSSGLVDYGVDLRMLRLQADRLADIVTTEPERDVQTNYLGSIPDASIRVEGMTYSYAGQDISILKECSFSIGHGESVAIVGPSGCGKSTLAKLLLGLLEPISGKIYIGGIDTGQLGKARVRELIGAVLQEDTLFAGSIIDNIAFFSERQDIEHVESVCRIAGIHDDIMCMTMGYNTLVGDMGSSLSSGQKQRIFLARALYKNPKILLLDEATSNLDVLRERTVNEAISQLDLTRVIIAHRPETISSADRVLMFDQGTLVSIDKTGPTGIAGVSAEKVSS